MELEMLFQDKILKEYKEKFEAYRALILEYNQRYNLTTILEEKDMYYKHFLDSAAGVDMFLENAKVAEIGSGAGFPSIVLKILRKDLSFDLFESVGKKCEFLHVVVDKLGLENVHIYNIRAEDAARDKNYRERYDHATARAVARMNTLSEYCLPFVKVGGTFIAFKGDVLEEANEAQNAVKTLGGIVDNIDYYQLDGAKRALVYIKKIKNTPAKYPRGNGKERKSPL